MNKFVHFSPFYSLISHKGFTLIELLIVIALIGALIVGLLAALDPVEQINRGQDVVAQRFTGDYINAQERAYAASNGVYAGGNVASPGYLMNAASGTTMATAMQTAGEVKASFLTQAASANVGGRVTLISQDNTSTTISMAYQVRSKAFKTNAALTRCTAVTGACTTCTAASATCYVRVTN